jgi:hypothetical protein
MAKRKVNVQLPVREFTDSLLPWQSMVWDDMKDHPEVTHRVIVVHRRGRKTTLGLNRLIWEAMRHPKTTHAYIGPTIAEAKRVVVRDPMMMKRYLPREILAKDFNETDLYAEFVNGSVLFIGGADQPDRWRGTGCKTWWLDEFAFARNGMSLYQEIVKPIVDENEGYVFFSFTPRGLNHGYTVWKWAQDDSKPDWKGWVLPVEETMRYEPEKLAEIKMSTPERIFAQEYLCHFRDDGGGLIRRVREAIAGNFERPRLGGHYVMGVDLARTEDWTVLTVLNTDTFHVDAWERFQQVDWELQRQRIAALAAKYNNPLCIVDATGMGGDVIQEDLRRLGLSVRAFTFTRSSKEELIRKLIVAIEGRRITYPNIEELVEELEAFHVDDHGRYRAPSGLHDDAVCSLALAIDGLGARVYAPSEPETRIRRRSARAQRDVVARAASMRFQAV